MSMDVLRSKMDSVNASGAGRVATANPGCMLQLQAGVKRFGKGQRVAHVIEILDEGLPKRRSNKRKSGRSWPRP